MISLLTVPQPKTYTDPYSITNLYYETYKRVGLDILCTAHENAHKEVAQTFANSVTNYDLCHFEDNFKIWKITMYLKS